MKKRLTQKEFERQCDELAELGYVMLEYEPQNKYAVYTRNGNVRTIGVRK